jgi:hypothetical protein
MLTYRLKGQSIIVEQRPGKTWRRIPIADL